MPRKRVSTTRMPRYAYSVQRCEWMAQKIFPGKGSFVATVDIRSKFDIKSGNNIPTASSSNRERAPTILRIKRYKASVDITTI
jgi:hypothetical protein